ncbi:ATP-dependent (S)-NAD(P)H-hydrate dehydratase-like [Arctopsyche grandis]|uniref:ATP-dependent (S)-NAD(P)H-hydrate dehydratase-like n=1 Tax=Arctopsyche grandis TaxID=121162 RepID=UPI00406D6789
MSAKHLAVLLLVCGLHEFGVRCDSYGGRAYSRYPACRKHLAKDDEHVKSLMKEAKPIMSVNNAKGHMGTIGILGGSFESFGGLYFAGKAALKVGADEVHIVCTRASAPTIQVICPDFVMHPIVDVDANKVVAVLKEKDVVLLGPGLELTQHSINVINMIIPQMKVLKKPLVIDLNEYFYTPAFLNSLFNYPEPGVILTVNAAEFEKIYAHMRSKDAFGDSHVNLDFNRIGANMLIHRKGCSDMAFTKYPASSWSLSEGGSARRSVGQGSVIAGATAIYYHWAMLTIGQNSTKASFGPMMQASVAAYSAATLMRSCNNKAVSELGRSVVTSDMVSQIDAVLYGMD